MEIIRCGWSERDDLYRRYHDQEWGKPVFDDAVLFEFLLLESFQAGLSWYTILRKREQFRKAFDHFNYAKIAAYNVQKIDDLLADTGIIRHRAKITAAINNAQCFIKVQQEYGAFADYLWKFTQGKPIVNHPKSLQEVPATTMLSDAIAQDLKKRGFKFLGSTTVYAYLQAVGVVDDHLTDCHSKQS